MDGMIEAMEHILSNYLRIEDFFMRDRFFITLLRGKENMTVGATFFESKRNG